MARGVCIPVCLSLLSVLVSVDFASGQDVLTPPYFNLAQGRNISATATCGETPEPELFCRLTGTTHRRWHYGTGFLHEDGYTSEVIQGQLCDYCNTSDPDRTHSAKFAIDGTERWWQSPPLSRGMDFNKVNLTIDLGQEFHVAYAIMKMGNSPRPGVWILEKSTDFGKTWETWQYFADTPSDCQNFFNTEADQSLEADDQIICSTAYSKVVPLIGGEIVVSLVNGRPNSKNFSQSKTLQEWTKATNIQMRLIRTKTLLGHLMAVARQDPTVTRRYYYSIKDISIGGRCVCNGHAQACDIRDPTTTRLMCDCQHNTCGEQCDTCCPGFIQKKWRRAIVDSPFECEPCNCYGHSTECIYDEEVDRLGQSIDIHGVYLGGGVCQNCQDNTMGNNCDQCVFGFYRPYNMPKNATDACQPCDCDLRVSTGECEQGSGMCLCRPEYAGVQCDRCAQGYYGYPDCIPCECHFNGTENGLCYVTSGSCPCKFNYDGAKCDECALGYYKFPECIPCECDSVGTDFPKTHCDFDTGNCNCKQGFTGRDCGQCDDGFYNYPHCDVCQCDIYGTVGEICNKDNGTCLCEHSFTGDSCGQCSDGFFGFPQCFDCDCRQPGSLSDVCDKYEGQCRCDINYVGRACEQCAPGFFNYPECKPCDCDLYGSLRKSCDQQTGQCPCRDNFKDLHCRTCAENFYNYPMCEVCNCNPAGAKEVPGYPLGGCGEVIQGLLCQCKDNVLGRNCDTCKPGFWNLDRNNYEGCEACECDEAGTISGLNKCDMVTGQCVCKPHVSGQDCNFCTDGYYNLEKTNPFGCIYCNCDKGGSLSQTCDKTTGQCKCKSTVTGRRCDQPIDNYFYPSLHQLRYELEDGYTLEGNPVRYGYDRRIFPDFSWRGYAILSHIQPEVILDITVEKPSLYQIIYRFVNREPTSVKGMITLTPQAQDNIVQEGEINFISSRNPDFATVSSSGVPQFFVFNPGKWSISTQVPRNVFLDYFVLIPQEYSEATELKMRVTNPCLPGQNDTCAEFEYPDIDSGFPTSTGDRAYLIDGESGTKVDARQHPDRNLTTDLGVDGLVFLNGDQKKFLIDLTVPNPGLYLMVVSYHNPSGRSQEVEVDVTTSLGTDKAKVILSSCPYSMVCRQVLKGDNGLEAVFNISTGFASLTFQGKNNVDLSIAAVHAIPLRSWSSDFIIPKIICIKVNGQCGPSNYEYPGESIRIDFEKDPNADLRATVLPNTILDPNTGLVNCVESAQIRDPLVLTGEISKPGQYVIVVHYYMPNAVSMDIPVTVYSDEKPIPGIFKASFCPNQVGCRKTITFEIDNIVRLTGREVRVVFDNKQCGNIWLDYLLIVPLQTFKNKFLDLSDTDQSLNFIGKCLDKSFNLKTDSELCREGAFTLTTKFNNGAIGCSCTVEGSRSFDCEQFGGQCQCKDHVIGRTCSACQPDYYGYPNCQACNCQYGLCHPVTGECICPPRVEGAQCDYCEPGAYGYDALIGCQSCNCDPDGVEGRDMNCDQLTGQCRCKENVGGRRCDTCLAGFYSFPSCMSCGCDTDGTTEEVCNQMNGLCLCKDNVEGELCDRCVDGMYNLDMDHPKGCTPCFCFDHTTECMGSDLRWDTIYDMTDWEPLIRNKSEAEMRVVGPTIALSAKDDGVLEENFIIYWFAPQAYLGKRLNSYGGTLKFTVLNSLARGVHSEGVDFADVLLTGSGMSVGYRHASQPQPVVPLDMEVPLVEYLFKHKETNVDVSKDQFLRILNNLQSLLIRGSYFSAVDEIRLTGVELQTAVENGPGQPAHSVEKCNCPANYIGNSCEICAPGSYRVASLGICQTCNCNGHSTDCDVQTGKCFNCQGNTHGDHCEMCLTGYYGDPATESCKICSCPMPVASNNFANTCDANEDGEMIYCDCRDGYRGPHCDECDAGYYGNPYNQTAPPTCQPCGCSNNIDRTRLDSCDRFSGACLICENDSAGLQCEHCRDWFWGDAVVNKDCKECSCDQCGTERCDRNTGECQCKTNVVGDHCDECRPYTWGYESCEGCQRCDCGLGSADPQCDLWSGRCNCTAGVEGDKCDHCQHGHWNLGAQGCQACDCEADGSVGCDAETGRCTCLQGVTGTRCERCLPRWVLMPRRGCQECDYCIHILLDDTDKMNQDASVVTRQIKGNALSIGAFKSLDSYNSTVVNLRPLVKSMKMMNSEAYRQQLTEQLKPVKDEVSRIQQEHINLENTADATMQMSRQLPLKVKDFAQLANESVQLTTELEIVGKEFLMYVNEIRRKMIDNRNMHSMDVLIRDGQSVLNVIGQRSFVQQNQSAYDDMEEAMSSLDQSEALKRQMVEVMNRTDTKYSEVIGLQHSLQDLKNATMVVDRHTDSAVNTIQRLKAVEIESLSRSEKLIQGEEMSAKKALKDSIEILPLSFENNATETIQDIIRESSKMEVALPNLIEKVDNLTKNLILQEAVNKSLVRAMELEDAAADLDKFYVDTRSLSENAVKASTAYKMIHNAVNGAEEMADKAVDATNGMEESLSVGHNVSACLAESRSLLDEAHHQLYNTQTGTDLMKEKYESDTAVNDADNDNTEVKDMLDVLQKKMNNLNDTRTNDETSELSNKISLTQDSVDNTRAKIADLSTIKIQDKMNFILKNTPAIREDIKESMRMAKFSQDNVPLMKSKLAQLTLNLDRMTNRTHQMKLDVRELKDKIARARDEANSIRVGLHFQGNTTVTLRNPKKIEDSGSLSELSLFFKTNQTDAILVYVGKNHQTGVDSISDLNRVKRQASDYHSDYLALELRGGRVVFTFNLGSGEASIASNRVVNDGKWHQIYAKRIGKTGTLIIKSESHEADDVTEGVSQGTFSVLELNKNTLFLAGGVPDAVKLPMKLTSQSFRGSMEDLNYNKEPMGLWNFEAGRNNNMGEKERSFKKAEYLDGIRFDGEGYAVINAKDLRLKAGGTKLKLQFKTYTEDGLMFFMGKVDYFSVEIRGGKVTFQYDLGGGAAIITSQHTYNDGQWHTLMIQRQKRNAILDLDESTESFKTETPGTLSGLEITKDIYFGGIDSQIQPHTNVMTKGFEGCIKDVDLGQGRKLYLSNKNLIKRSKGIIRGCPEKEIYQVSFPRFRTGYIALKPVNIGATFDVTFKIKTSAQNALLMVASDQSLSNVFIVSLMKGKVIVTEQVGSQTRRIITDENTYADSQWHYISIMRMSKELTLSIDDSIMLHNHDGVKELATDQPIYFGGLPPEFGIPDILANQEGLHGCIGDITINKEFKNLALNKDLTEKVGVVLDECTVRDVKEEKSKVPPSKDQCMLAPISSVLLDGQSQQGNFQFGSHPYSRVEYMRVPTGIKHKPVTIRVSFRTTSQNGVIFYMSDRRHIDFISVYIQNGKVKFSFNCGSGSANIESQMTYNNGEWNSVKVTRARKSGILYINGVKVASGRSRGGTRSLNTIAPLYVGGFRDKIVTKKAERNLKASTTGFVGCIANMTFNAFEMNPDHREKFDVTPCSNDAEPGTFVGIAGGYVADHKTKQVGEKFEIEMDVKPRTQEGVLMAVHSDKTDFAVLQLTQGEVVFSVENGNGPITIRYVPETPNSMCDGNWHRIQAKKSNHELELSVNGIKVEKVSGNPKVKSADTNGPMYFGGIDRMSKTGILANGDFKGCLKNVKKNGQMVYLSTYNVTGDVNVNRCPLK